MESGTWNLEYSGGCGSLRLPRKAQGSTLPYFTCSLGGSAGESGVDPQISPITQINEGGLATEITEGTEAGEDAALRFNGQ